MIIEHGKVYSAYKGKKKKREAIIRKNIVDTLFPRFKESENSTEREP